MSGQNFHVENANVFQKDLIFLYISYCRTSPSIYIYLTFINFLRYVLTSFVFSLVQWLRTKFPCRKTGISSQTQFFLYFNLSIIFYMKIPLVRQSWLYCPKTCCELSFSGFLPLTVRGRSRAAATSKMERSAIIVNSFQPLTIITKCSILDVSAALDPSLTVPY